MATDTNCNGVLNSGPLMPFDSMVGDSYSEEADKECEQSFYAQPVQDTQPPDPSALLRPCYRYPWPARSQALQQNVAADSTSQTSLSIDAVLARIETRLMSLEEQLNQIENKVSNLHNVMALDRRTTCTSNTSSSIITPQQETPLGASGPYAMADVSMGFCEAKKCQERDFSASTAQCLGQTLNTYEVKHVQSPRKEAQSSRKKQTHAFLGIQQCPVYFTLDDDSATTKVPTSRGVGVVWSIRLSQRMSSNNSHHIPTETTATIYSGRLMECPKCSCLMQLGAQIEIQNSTSGVAVDLLIKRLDIVRIPTSNRLFRHDCCSCEIKNYYITVKVRFGENVSRQTFWKFTI